MAAATTVLAGCSGFIVQEDDLGQHVVNGPETSLGAKGVREWLTGGGEALKFFITLTRHPDAEPCRAPDNIIVLDSTGRTLPMLGPGQFAALVHGQTTEGALADSMASQAGANYYVLQQQQMGSSSQGGFAGGMAAGVAQGMQAAAAGSAAWARETAEKTEREARDALQPQVILPNAYIGGRIWTVTGEPPYSVNVFACGEHLEVTVDGEESTGRVRATTN